MDNIITSQLKQLFNTHIDMILAKDGLTVPCLLKYDASNAKYCNNCIYDSVLNQSLNKYNGTGPKNFAEGTICPVCNGFGKTDVVDSETVYLAVILDSKYWLNWGPKFIATPNLAAQTICSIDLINKIDNCSQAILNTNIQSSLNNNLYTKIGPPTPLGFGSQDYILTPWSQP